MCTPSFCDEQTSHQAACQPQRGRFPESAVQTDTKCAVFVLLENRYRVGQSQVNPTQLIEKHFKPYPSGSAHDLQEKAA